MTKTDRQILHIAGPAILANITTPLLGLVDTAIAGHLGSPMYIAAIAVGSTMFNLLYWLLGFLRMGTSGMTARAYGARDDYARALTLRRAQAVALILAIIIILLQKPLADMLLGFIDADAVTTSTARTYFDILIYGAPAMLTNYVVTGWLIGMQDTRTTLGISLLINIVNIASSLVCVYLLDMGVRGIAAGTLVAQWVGAVTGLTVITLKYKPVRTSFSAIFEPSGVKSFFSVNTDIFLRTVCLVAQTLWFTHAGAAGGDIILAANAVLMQFFIFFSYFLDGFAYAGEALVGHTTGQKDNQATRLTIRRLMLLGGIVAILFTIVYALGGDAIISLITSEHEVIDSASEYKYWVISIPLAGFMAFTWDGIFIGAALQRLMLLSIAIATAVFFIVCALCMPSMGNHGLWLAFVLYLATRGLTQSLFFKPRPHDKHI